MTKPQESLYWRQWAALVRARPDLRALKAAALDTARRAEHAKLDLPGSHKEWGTRSELDAWIAHCQAAADPSNFRVQIKQGQMPAARVRYVIALLLAALGKPQPYAEAILSRQNPGHGFSLVNAPESALHKVRLSLMHNFRFAWRDRGGVAGLRQHLRAFAAAEALEEAILREATLDALGAEFTGSPDPARLTLDHLALVLGAWRQLTRAEVSP